MATLREWVSRFWATLGPGRSDRDLEQELRTHLAFAEADAQRTVPGSGGAARAAAIRSGGVPQAMEALRDQRGLSVFSNVARDVRYGCRTLASNPGFTIVAAVSLAIGIGVNCAVFSFADALLLRPLPVPRAADVVTVGSPGSVRPVLVASYPEYVDLRDRSTGFDGLVALTESVALFATGAETLPKPTIGMLVTGNFFTVMGVEPALGRAFRPDEDQVPGRDPVVVLSHDFWKREFGADPTILGRTVRLNAIAFTVIGVAPARFTSLDQYTRYEFYAPLMMWPRLLNESGIQPLEARDFRRLSIKGRLKPGVTMSQVRTEIAVIARELERANPDLDRQQPIAVRTELQERLAGYPQLLLLILMLATLAAAVLFVACANVAGLLVSRAPMRAREIALRLAIGAGRSRVIQQLITESVMIALLGGGLGLGVGYAGVTLFRQWRIPTDLPIAASFELDGRALMVSVIVALVSAVLFGLAPAIRATREDLTAVMKATDAAGFGRRRRWGRASLVGGQVAISVVLLVVAMFVYRGFQQRFASGPGFRTDHVLLMWFDPTLVHDDESQVQPFFEQLAVRARLVPGVKSAALASYVPMDGGVGRVSIVPEGFVFPVGTANAAVPSAVVDEQYFDTLSIPIIAGRGFRGSDGADTPRVAIVNEPFAQHYLPGQDPVGRRFRLNDGGGPWVEIVGLAKASKYVSIIEPPVDFVYFPYKQRPQHRMALMAESIADPSSLVAPLREMVRNLDPTQPIFNVRTLEENYRMRAVVLFDVVITLIAAMGFMGLVLAIVGLYGLVAYAVGRRTREIGIRMAIGAAQGEVFRMVLREGTTISVAGLGVGLLASLGVSRALAAVFPGGPGGDGRTDVVAFLLVAAIVLVVTLLAACVPARRASHINPTEALRAD